MAETTDKVAKVADLAVSLAMIGPIALLRGLVLKDLWRWFLVPLGLHPIGMANALGVALIFGYAGYTYVDNKDEFPGVANTARAVAVSLLCWGFGAIYHHFM